MPLTQELLGERKGLQVNCVLCRKDSSSSEHGDHSGPRWARINRVSVQLLRCLFLKALHFADGASLIWPCWWTMAEFPRLHWAKFKLPCSGDLRNLSRGNVGISETWVWLSFVGDRTVIVVLGRSSSRHLLLSWAGAGCRGKVFAEGRQLLYGTKNGC